MVVSPTALAITHRANQGNRRSHLLEEWADRDPQAAKLETGHLIVANSAIITALSHDTFFLFFYAGKEIPGVF